MQPVKPIEEASAFFCTADFCMRPDAEPGDLPEEVIIQYPTDKPVNDHGESL
jgi:hypothetical protein